MVYSTTYTNYQKYNMKVNGTIFGKVTLEVGKVTNDNQSANVSKALTPSDVCRTPWRDANLQVIS